MPKYWVKNYFAHGRFPEVGQKQKTEKREREKEERKYVITMAKLLMAHASTYGARKPPGPIYYQTPEMQSKHKLAMLTGNGLKKCDTEV